MAKIDLRYQRVSDAERFFEILRNPNFIYFKAKPKSIAEERKILKKRPQERKSGLDYNYSILLDKKLVGGAGIKINPHYKDTGEIGYFVAEEYWGKGIATKTVKLLEKIGFNKLKLERIEIRMNPKNKASVKVAVKCGYKKEGLLHGKKENLYLFAKLKK
jgi:[ribosomal protein S5]-alanine N-acetyltransferase